LVDDGASIHPSAVNLGGAEHRENFSESVGGGNRGVLRRPVIP